VTPRGGGSSSSAATTIAQWPAASGDGFWRTDALGYRSDLGHPSEPHARTFAGPSGFTALDRRSFKHSGRTPFPMAVIELARHAVRSTRRAAAAAALGVGLPIWVETRPSHHEVISGIWRLESDGGRPGCGGPDAATATFSIMSRSICEPGRTAPVRLENHRQRRNSFSRLDGGAYSAAGLANETPPARAYIRRRRCRRQDVLRGAFVELFRTRSDARRQNRRHS